MSDRYGPETKTRIASLWGRFMHHLGHIPAQVGDVAYGVCYNDDDTGHFDYMACVEVGNVAKVPEAFETLFLPARRYAIFVHRGPVERLGETWARIHDDWMATPGAHVARAPSFERYDAGVVEIWIPLER